MLSTRLMEGLLGSHSASEEKESSALSQCSRLVFRLEEAQAPNQQLEIIRELGDLSHQYPYLPLGGAATKKVLSLIEEHKNDEKDGGRVLRPCVTLLQNISKPVPDNHDEHTAPKHKKILRDNLTHITPSVLVLMEVMVEADPIIQLATVKLLTNILHGRKAKAQQLILAKPMAVNRVVALLDTQGEIVRNEALLLLKSLIHKNPTIQKIVAFDGVFDKVLAIAESEGYLMGGMIVLDTMELLSTLLHNNTSNQSLFVETGCVKRLVPFLTAATAKTSNNMGMLGGLSDQKLQVLTSALTVLLHLLPSTHRVSQAKELCPSLLAIASSNAMPARLRALSLHIIAKLIDSRPRNQACLVSGVVSIVPVITDFSQHISHGGGIEAREESRPALVYLLKLALGVDESSVGGVDTTVMCKALLVIKSLLRKNFGGQAAVCQSLSHASTSSAKEPSNNAVMQFALELVQSLQLDGDSRKKAHAYLRTSSITESKQTSSITESKQQHQKQNQQQQQQQPTHNNNNNNNNINTSQDKKKKNQRSTNDNIVHVALRGKLRGQRSEGHRAPASVPVRARSRGVYARVKRLLFQRLKQTKKGRQWTDDIGLQQALLQDLAELGKQARKASYGIGGRTEACIARMRTLLNEKGGAFSHLLDFSSSPVRCPLRPGSDRLIGVVPEKSTMFKSALAPLLVTFRTEGGGTKRWIFKSGDDLRQDQLVIFLIERFDRCFKASNVDLALTPYRILATSPNEGLVEFVEGSTTLSKIRREANTSSKSRSTSPKQQQRRSLWQQQQQQQQQQQLTKRLRNPYPEVVVVVVVVVAVVAVVVAQPLGASCGV